MSTLTAQKLPEGTWWMWALGIGAAVGTVYLAAVVAADLADPMPWADGHVPKIRDDFEGLALAVVGDEAGYMVVVYEALKVVNGELLHKSFRYRSVEHELKKDALLEARALAKEARASGRYKLVKVMHTAEQLAGWDEAWPTRLT